jgi:hypothetical protein
MPVSAYMVFVRDKTLSRDELDITAGMTSFDVGAAAGWAGADDKAVVGQAIGLCVAGSAQNLVLASAGAAPSARTTANASAVFMRATPCREP